MGWGRRALSVRFTVDGEPVVLADPDPTQHLVDLLRSPVVGRFGTKLVCGEAGCGACTVVISRRDAITGETVRRAINSCVHPVCQLDGVEVTTAQGIGSVSTGLHPIQRQLCEHDGSQCGFCSPGFVMAMYGLLAERSAPTPQQIEDHFDGNLCRCTGYRPILDAMHAFDGGAGVSPIPLPEPLGVPRGSSVAAARGIEWLQVDTMAALISAVQEHGAAALVNGNTSFGIYPDDIAAQPVRIDISRLTDLTSLAVAPDGVSIGAGVTLAELMTFIDALKDRPPESMRGLNGLRRHLERVGSAQVRNVATLGGNVAMTLRHATSDDPFPSDVLLLLIALGASASVITADGVEQSWSVEDLPDPTEAGYVLRSFTIPYTRASTRFASFKVARRIQSSHALVNAAVCIETDGAAVKSGRIVVGGIGGRPIVCAATMRWLQGRVLGPDTFDRARSMLSAEAAEHLVPMPAAGVPDAYRVDVAGGLIYSALVTTALEVAPGCVPPDLRSAGEAPVRPISSGTAEYPPVDGEAPVGLPIHALPSAAQAAGEAIYTHDVPAPPRTLHAAYVYGGRPHASFDWSPYGGLEALLQHLREHDPAVVDIVTAADVPGDNIGGFGGDEPLFAEAEVTAYGMPIALVLATDQASARSAAEQVMATGIRYRDLAPVALTIDEALDLPDRIGIFEDDPARHLEHLHGITRPGSDETWLADPRPVPGRGFVAGRQDTGGQVHFYLETQSALVVPGEPGTFTVHASTQDLASVQGRIASALAIPANGVTVRTIRIGGGYGGKETRPPFFAAAAAVGSHKTGRPVRLVLDRHTDSVMMGGRHPFRGDYWLTFDETGLIDRWRLDLYADGGNTYDVTFPVSDLAVLSADGAYDVPTFGVNATCVRTNRATNTAMRSFGVIQCSLVCEDAIERVAYELRMLPEEVRARNFYVDSGLHRPVSEAPTTPYGQELRYGVMQAVWLELAKRCAFAERRAEVARFNAENRWRKRGISMTPIKYGVSYTFVTGNQGGALITVNETDGTVTLATGGIEMGQGLSTKLVQIAAMALGIDMSLIRCVDTITEVVPNASSTGASTGSDLNGGATKLAAIELVRRLRAFCRDNPDLVHGIDWEHDWSRSWGAVVRAAYGARIDLSAQALYRSPDLSEVSNANPIGRPFYYFSYSAACSEVEINVLTGEATVLRADILYDAGHSLNPALDIGQIRGGFIQGLGNVTSEFIYYRPDGRPFTDGTWSYKIPASKDIPIDLRVGLLRYDRPSPHDDLPLDPHGIQSSKSSGEPPLVLANSVFFAIKHATIAAREAQGLPGWCALEAPATPDRIREACAGRSPSDRTAVG